MVSPGVTLPVLSASIAKLTDFVPAGVGGGRIIRGDGSGKAPAPGKSEGMEGGNGPVKPFKVAWLKTVPAEALGAMLNCGVDSYPTYL